MQIVCRYDVSVPEASEQMTMAASHACIHAKNMDAAATSTGIRRLYSLMISAKPEVERKQNDYGR
jgi:hypothetical protein